MSDVSGNEIIDDVTNGDQLNEVEFQTIVSDPIDYTNYFENLQNIGFIILTVVIAIGIVLCFVQGFNKNG